MIIFRPHRRMLYEAMAEAKEFNNVEEMKEDSKSDFFFIKRNPAFEHGQTGRTADDSELNYLFQTGSSESYAV